MNTTVSNHTIAALIAHIVSECSPVDREEAFSRMLDECYSFKSVGGPFAHMQPSDVLKECDPTAFRCGVNDWADSEEWTEIEGETYRNDDIEKAREEFVDGLNDELSDLERELEELEEPNECEPGIVGTFDEIAEKKSEISALESFISEVERHSF